MEFHPILSLQTKMYCIRNVAFKNRAQFLDKLIVKVILNRWLTELPYWFKITFFVKILTRKGEKDHSHQVCIFMRDFTQINLVYAR